MMSGAEGKLLGWCVPIVVGRGTSVWSWMSVRHRMSWSHWWRMRWPVPRVSRSRLSRPLRWTRRRGAWRQFCLRYRECRGCCPIIPGQGAVVAPLVGQHPVFVVHLGGAYAATVSASLGVQNRDAGREELVEVLVGRHDQMFACWLGGDEGGDHVIGFPPGVLHPADTQQGESVLDAGQVSENVLITGHRGL
jgi:hypothetical protein